jgi:hypothetical protein
MVGDLSPKSTLMMFVFFYSLFQNPYSNCYQHWKLIDVEDAHSLTVLLLDTNIGKNRCHYISREKSGKQSSFIFAAFL